MKTRLQQAILDKCIVVSSFKFELKSLIAAGANWDIENHYFETSVNPENGIGSPSEVYGVAFVRPNIYVLLETDELSEIRGLIPCFPDGIKNNVFSMLLSLDITDARLRNISQGLLIGVNPVRTLHSSSLALCSSCPINFRLKRNDKKRIMVKKKTWLSVKISLWLTAKI